MKPPDEKWLSDLQALPVLAPAPALWQRLARKRQMQLRIRNAGVAGVLCVALSLPLALRWNADDNAGAPALAAPTTTTPAERLADLRAVDRALQAAYESGASDDELAPLWRARSALALQAAAHPASDTTPMPQQEKRS